MLCRTASIVTWVPAALIAFPVSGHIAPSNKWRLQFSGAHFDIEQMATVVEGVRIWPDRE